MHGRLCRVASSLSPVATPSGETWGYPRWLLQRGAKTILWAKTEAPSCISRCRGISRSKLQTTSSSEAFLQQGGLFCFCPTRENVCMKNGIEEQCWYTYIYGLWVGETQEERRTISCLIPASSKIIRPICKELYP